MLQPFYFSLGVVHKLRLQILPIIDHLPTSVYIGWHLDYHLPTCQRWHVIIFSPILICSKYLVLLHNHQVLIAVGLVVWGICIIYCKLYKQNIHWFFWLLVVLIFRIGTILKNVNVDIELTTYLPLVDICWHLDNHLPTWSCKRSLWTTPYSFLEKFQPAYYNIPLFHGFIT